MNNDDKLALAKAFDQLNRVSFASRISDLMGKPIAVSSAVLPETAKAALAHATDKALQMALRAAISSVRTDRMPSSHRLHRSLAVASGTAGGAFGLAALPVELPVSTLLILRSIAAIAREQGEAMSDTATALACIEVFALSGRTPGDETADSGYFALRALLARSVSDAAVYLSQHAGARETAPVLVRLISIISSRFGVAVSQKLLAQSVPVLGAAGGAGINYAFMLHFQNIAEGHFTMRRLERAYGTAIVRSAYERLAGTPVDDNKAH